MVLVLGRDHVSHNNEYALSSTLSIYGIYISPLYLGIVKLPSYAIVDSYLFYDGDVNMQI